MTVGFYSTKKKCEKTSKEINDFFRRPMVKCLKVKITNISKADDCGLRPRPRRKVGTGSKGYIVGRNIGEFKGCGLSLIR